MLRGLMTRLERANKLDRYGDPVQQRVLHATPERARDVLHGVPLGHPLHPALVEVPIGAWISAAVFDALPGLRACATALVGLGTAAAVPTAAAGLADWAEQPPHARRVGLVHAVANMAATGLYAASLAARFAGRQRLGRGLGYAGLGAVSFGGFLGGHLSFRYAGGMNRAEPLITEIPAGWHDLCEFRALAENQPFTAHIGEVPVLVTRSGDRVTAMLARCGHESGPLGEGEVTQIGGAACVVCPWHGSTFRLADGTVVHGPAATDQPVLRTRINQGCVQAAVA